MVAGLRSMLALSHRLLESEAGADFRKRLDKVRAIVKCYRLMGGPGPLSEPATHPPQLHSVKVLEMARDADEPKLTAEQYIAQQLVCCFELCTCPVFSGFMDKLPRLHDLILTASILAFRLASGGRHLVFACQYPDPAHHRPRAAPATAPGGGAGAGICKTRRGVPYGTERHRWATLDAAPINASSEHTACLPAAACLPLLLLQRWCCGALTRKRKR